MQQNKYGKLGLIVLLSVQVILAATYTVSKDGRGQFSTVQAAIDAAKAPGDVVEILDFDVYNEQVTIDSSKSGLTLRSENPKSITKPTIKWLDEVNVGPTTAAEALIPEKINFDQNGALRVMKARGVTIEGIAVDGGGAYPFGYPAVWNGKDELFHGNAAITLWIAGDAIIRYCDLKNAYFGINVKDRNEGGIFANANPADIQKWLVVPLSGFGKTGNHLIEQNRIHDNSWGMFFESAWDLGSTIRYNLFYENHHATSTLSEAVKKLPGGDHQAGGALFFKDILLSPVAIYNNTFWHNYLIFAAHWRAGSQHLVFNNLYGAPYMLWADNPDFQNPFHKMDNTFANRMFNSLYAGQIVEPGTQTQNYQFQATDTATNTQVRFDTLFTGISQMRIMNDLPNPAQSGQDIVMSLVLSNGDTLTRTENASFVIQPGAIVAINTPDKAFPASANIRWWEMTFLSTDPTSPDFLTPDWDDTLVQKLIIDQGWKGAGIRDADGTIADLGAIPMGGIPSTEIIVKPAEPVFIDGTKATVVFDIKSIAGTMQNPHIKYVRWIKNIPFQENAFGGNVKPMPAADIVAVNIPNTPLKIGGNTLVFDIPARAATELYAFFEIVVEGTTAEGDTIASNVGFLPYRKLDYTFDVKIWDPTGSQEISTVYAGETVYMTIEPKKIGQSGAFTATISPVEISLNSQFNLLSAATGNVFTLASITGGKASDTVVFTKVPDGGFDRVSVSGIFSNPNQPDINFAIRGSSPAITILPGEAAKIAFQDPPSNGSRVVDPGISYPVQVQAFDKYDNKVNTATSIAMVSSKPDIGDVVAGQSPMNTDSTGLAFIQVKVTSGKENDTFPIVATLVSKGVTDNAKIVVGKPRDKFWIYYGDTLGFDENAKIDMCAGIRVPVTIRASKDGLTVETSSTASFEIDFDKTSLVAYASDSPTDVAKIAQGTLVAGQAVIWVTSAVGYTKDNNPLEGAILITPLELAAVQPNNRQKIFFKECYSSIDRATYSATTGSGSVDRVDLFYKKPIVITDFPDSLELYWPRRDATARNMVADKSVMLLDPADSTHVTVMLPQPFPPAITSGSSSQMGTSYWANPLTPDVVPMPMPFNISDGVGPLLLTATLIERLGAGVDTIAISFTESVLPDSVKGLSLTLVKNGAEVQLEIINVAPKGQGVFDVAIRTDPLGAVNTPVEGDSLRITAAGPISDVYGNKAHPLNRPVEIKLRAIPADINAAVYQDLNADGIVDNLRITFNKSVNTDQLKVAVKWADFPAWSDTVTGGSMAYVAGTKKDTINVAISSIFGVQANVANKTAGGMSMVAVFTAFDNTVKTAAVTDEAAPVLTAVEYHFGKAGSNNVVEADTLLVKYSEPTTVTGTNPYLFQGATAPYTVTVKATAGSGQVAYTVDVTGLSPAAVIPHSGDSVWIATSGPVVQDMSSNTQMNQANKRVLLKVVIPEAQMVIKSGPNPFNPLGQPFTLTVEPVTKVAANVKITVQLQIFDQVGNEVLPPTPISNKDGEIAVSTTWNGVNKNGRVVGNGTYIGKLIVTDGSALKVTKQTVLIGVKR